jgi:hypothetical protein
MINRYFRSSLSAVAILGLTGLMVSCSGSKTNEGQSSADTLSAAAELVDSAGAPEDKTQDFIQSLPSPIHVARIFNRAGLKYVAGLTNPGRDAEKYQSASARALNLGVYTTDLAYSTFNNQNQAAVDYFRAVQKIGDGLDMSAMFQGTNLVPRFEKNLGNKDSLLYLMSQLSLESDLLLKGAKRMDVVTLSFAGAWTESIYLTTTLLAENKNLELYNRLQDQQSTLPKLIALLEAQNLEETKSTIEGLKEIQSKLDRIVANGASIGSSEFTDFAASVRSFREKIIKTV